MGYTHVKHPRDSGEMGLPAQLAFHLPVGTAQIPAGLVDFLFVLAKKPKPVLLTAMCLSPAQANGRITATAGTRKDF